ncbi:MAG: trypsin-like peptidase domain-containing protein [Euryarchaeota archaeon]|nr:trypsin-like peptidase domain-containing protein [Euryarchaeota archaeon]
MNEITTIGKKPVNKYPVLLIAIFIVSMFIVGYLVGGSLNYGTTSSEINQLQQQIEILQNKNNNVEFQNNTYYYNDTALAQLYEDVKNSIVVIYGSVAYQSFFGTQYSEVQGSGFVYDFDGELVVITNKHVVDGATDIIVTFSNGDSYTATTIGSDAYSDLAVLSVQAPAEEFKPIKIVSSSNLKVGDPLIAIGSPFGLGGTMTTGVISQLGRTIEDSVAGSFPIANIIQTSVPINPGNSGGPLLNYQGEVVGITTAIIQNSNGLGFAIPSNTILREIESLIKTGSYNQHSWLGISGVDMSYSIAQAMKVNVTYGWLITQTTSEGAADKAGLKGSNQQVRINGERVTIGGDIIIAVDGTRIINGDSFMSYLEEHTAPNQIVTVTIVRSNQILDIPVELGTRPAAG